MDKYRVTVNGVSYEVEVEKLGSGASSAPAAPAKASMPTPIVVTEPMMPKDAGEKGDTAITAGAAGKVWKVVAKPGQAVQSGDSVVIIEAMKMEIPVVAPKAGTIVSIDCSEGQACEAGDLLATMK